LPGSRRDFAATARRNSPKGDRAFGQCCGHQNILPALNSCAGSARQRVQKIGTGIENRSRRHGGRCNSRR